MFTHRTDDAVDDPGRAQRRARRDNGFNLLVAELHLGGIHRLRDAVRIEDDDVAGLSEAVNQLVRATGVAPAKRAAKRTSGGRTSPPVARRRGAPVPEKWNGLSCPALQ